MKVNEKWFAVLPGSSKVQTLQVMEITAATVLVRDLRSGFLGIGGHEERYQLHAIKFIEQLPDDYQFHQFPQEDNANPN